MLASGSLSGGPGSGKSSFAKMYAAKAASQGHRVLFIPLHQFNVAGSLPAAVGEFVRGSEILPINPLDPESAEGQLLILFDGLDELSQQGRLAAEVARDFVREVQKAVEIRNQQNRRLLVLITGREPVVQANASEMRERRRILHALPYLVGEGESTDSGQEILKEDQRQEWWRRYAKATGQTYKGLPQELSRDDLSEITAQPLLNYLVALSLARKPGDQPQRHL
jgi:ATPase family associated with various cellular activities (AAA)